MKCFHYTFISKSLILLLLFMFTSPCYSYQHKNKKHKSAIDGLYLITNTFEKKFKQGMGMIFDTKMSVRISNGIATYVENSAFNGEIMIKDIHLIEKNVYKGTYVGHGILYGGKEYSVMIIKQGFDLSMRSKESMLPDFEFTLVDKN